MIRNKILPVLLCLLTLQVSAQSKRQRKQLDSIFSMMYRQHQFNGSVLIAEKGKIVFEKGYGIADELHKKKNTPATEFELASCSKQFTAAAVMLLHREGKLRFEDRLASFIPELGFWDKVTLSDLLHHTSGIPEYLVNLPKNWKSTGIATNEDLIKFYALRKDSLQFATGSRHRYNNTNYALLASVIERVSGVSYADYLNQKLFRPLKMKHTFVYNKRQQPLKLRNNASGYVWAKGSFDKVRSDDQRYGDSMVYILDGIVGNAKVNSTLRDLYKWTNALKNNTFFTSEEFEKMTAITKTSAGRDILYGFGLDVSKGKDRFSFGHTGSWDGFATFTYHNMLKDRTIITLQNFKMGAYPYQNINEILDGKPLTMEYKKKIGLTEKEIQKWTGTYIDPANGNEIQYISYLDGHLVHNSKRVSWDMRFFPISNNEFSAIRQGGAEGILKFSTLENGDLKLEMLEYGEVIGVGIKKNAL